MSTKIDSVVDNLGNPVGWPVSEEQASGLEGAGVLLADIETEVVIADKSYEARVVEPLQARDITVVLPSFSNHQDQRENDNKLDKARHLLENFFAQAVSRYHHSPR